jgi:nicotinamide riboside kinase
MMKDKSKLITIMGAPSSGKSTLASELHTQLKKLGKNSIYITEAATDYIAEWGVPNSPTDQIVIFYKQLNREKMYLGTKEFIVCDSSGILNYFYFRGLFDKKLTNKDIATINHLQKEILKTINQWDFIFYIPPILENTEDGIRYHNVEDIIKIDRWIKSYLELENIPHIDLSGIEINKRLDFILDIINKKIHSK